MTESAERHYNPEDTDNSEAPNSVHDNISHLDEYRAKNEANPVDAQILRDQHAIELSRFRLDNQDTVRAQYLAGISEADIAAALGVRAELVEATIAGLRRRKEIPGMRELKGEMRSKAIEQSLAENPDLSLRTLGQIHGVSHETARKWIKRKNLRDSPLQESGD